MSVLRKSRRPARRVLGLAVLSAASVGLVLLLGTPLPQGWLAPPALERAAAAAVPALRTTLAATAAPAAALAVAGAYLGQQRPLTSAAVLLGGSALAAAAAAVLLRPPGVSALPRDVAMAGVPAGLDCPEDADPSLFVTTNVKLGDKKGAFMQAASKAVAKCLGKPESYVAVCVQDGQDIIWGGSDAPCALCKVLSLGSINLENNRALTQEISGLLAEFEVPQNRIYVNFFDMDRQNVGYNGATFAG
nr:macrophage migration inhibitory factor [Lingulodinium polyedra]|mmetsp:Transcript_26041/g.82301  ORF Transcript_26041/g.82301 Transcript_26041/m.82301 type:complete len:247 (-) Transcript_26041:188-928(-)